MKALDEYFLMVVFTLLLNRVYVFAIFYGERVKLVLDHTIQMNSRSPAKAFSVRVGGPGKRDMHAEEA